MFASNALILALAGLVAAQTPTPGGFETVPVPVNGTVVTVTKVYTAYTTVCTGPTTFEFNGQEYSVTEATTLTITDCPCTVVETTGQAVSTSQSGWGSGGKVINEEEPSEQPYIEPTTSTAEVPGSTPSIASGASGFQISLGLAAALGLLAL